MKWWEAQITQDIYKSHSQYQTEWEEIESISLKSGTRRGCSLLTFDQGWCGSTILQVDLFWIVIFRLEGHDSKILSSWGRDLTRPHGSDLAQIHLGSILGHASSSQGRRWSLGAGDANLAWTVNSPIMESKVILEDMVSSTQCCLWGHYKIHSSYCKSSRIFGRELSPITQ